MAISYAFRAFVIISTGVVYFGSSALGQGKPLRDQLIGIWTLVSNDHIASDGVRRQLFGANPKGVLILDADGRYAHIQVDPNRPKFKRNSRLQGTAEENRAALRGATASFGTWSVDESKHLLVFNVEGSLFPNREGGVTRRSIALSGDELRYTNPATSGGKAEAVYKRAR